MDEGVIHHAELELYFEKRQRARHLTAVRFFVKEAMRGQDVTGELLYAKERLRAVWPEAMEE